MRTKQEILLDKVFKEISSMVDIKVDPMDGKLSFKIDYICGVIGEEPEWYHLFDIDAIISDRSWEKVFIDYFTNFGLTKEESLFELSMFFEYVVRDNEEYFIEFLNTDDGRNHHFCLQYTKLLYGH